MFVPAYMGYPSKLSLKDDLSRPLKKTRRWKVYEGTDRTVFSLIARVSFSCYLNSFQVPLASTILP